MNDTKESTTIDMKIECCRHCGNPLIWTFIYPGAEWYCVKCGGSYGMLGGSIKKPATAERVELHKQLNDEFTAAIEGYVYGGCQYDDCPKCKEYNKIIWDEDDNSEDPRDPDGRYHIWHLTKEETIKHEAAVSRLNALITKN